jgi:hypothetical protein
MDSAEHTVIPAFTVFEIEMSCKGWSQWEVGDVNENAKNKAREICPVKKGYGMGISSMKPMAQSLYSFQDELRYILKASPSDATDKQRGFEENNKPINQMISQQNVPFLVQKFGPDTHIVWDADHKLIKITNWGESGEDPIDIAEEHAMAFTNSSTMEDACRLIELAYMTGNLIMPSFYDQFRKGREDVAIKSVFHGVPLIQTAKLFESVAGNVTGTGELLTDPTGKYYVFTPQFKLLDEDEKEVAAQIMVSKELLHVSSDVQGIADTIPTPDLCLVGLNMPVKKGYYMRILRGDVVCWGGYCNLSKPNIYASVHNGDGAAVCRKRWASQAAVVFDPFAAKNPGGSTTGGSKKRREKVGEEH